MIIDTCKTCIYYYVSDERSVGLGYLSICGKFNAEILDEADLLRMGYIKDISKIMLCEEYKEQSSKILV